jgi:voltage-gated potassium channel
MARLILIERRMAKFLAGPVTVRSAAAVIVTSTVVVVIGSGVLIRLLDHREYPNIFIGMWWAVQTVTTVGYGDVTPTSVAGRLVAALVMLEGIALVAIVTAAVTSTFVERAAHLRDAADAKGLQHEEEQAQARYDELVQRFDRMEAMLRGLGAG